MRALLTILTLCCCLTAYAEDAIQVSIIQLIAHPEKYDKKLVSVQGYLSLEFEGSAIYLHRDDWINLNTKNGLWYAGDILQVKKFEHGYVNIDGTFIAKDKGHFGLWSGTISKVTRVWPSVRPGPIPPLKTFTKREIVRIKSKGEE